jgi:hypothetical protein
MAKQHPVSDLKPSQVTSAYWLTARRRKGKYPAHSKRGGKWLIFVPSEEVDEVWARVKSATENGLLGERAKVATAKPNPNAKNPSTRVICIYTYDSADEADVRRIREELPKLGFTGRIPYKTNGDTFAGKYASRGHRHISKFLE